MSSPNEIVVDVSTVEIVVSEAGVQGPAGEGVPAGGTTGQVLAKASGTDFDTEWADDGGGGGGLDEEAVRDAVAGFLVGGSGVTVTHDDGADTLTIDRDALALGDIPDLSSVYAAAAHTHAAEEIDSGTLSDSRLSSAVTQRGNTFNGPSLLVQLDFAGNMPAVDASAVTGLTLSQITDAGTAAAVDVPASGDASSSEAVLGDDTRLTDDRDPTAHTHTLSEVTDAGTAAALNVASSGDAASGEVVKGDDSRLLRYDEIAYAQSLAEALGTGEPARAIAITERKITGAGIALDASDTGDIEIRILNAAGVEQHAATVSISAAVSVLDLSLSWDTGDGTVAAGEIIEIERTSGFATATSIHASVRFEETI